MNPSWAPILVRESGSSQFTIYIVLKCLHSNLSNCRIVVYENIFLIYISVLNFELLLGPKYWSEGHDFKNLKSTQSDDACLVLNIISCRIVVHRLYYLRMLDRNITKSSWKKIFKHFSYTCILLCYNLNPFRCPSIGLWVTSLTI